MIQSIVENMRSVLLLFEYFHVHLIAHLFAFLIIFSYLVASLRNVLLKNLFLDYLRGMGAKISFITGIPSSFYEYICTIC